MEIFSDEDEDFSSPEEGSDSEPMLDDQVSHTRRLMSGRKARGLGAGKSNAAAARQRNLKQKFVSLLKKFKVTDPEELDQEQANLDQKISGNLLHKIRGLFGKTKGATYSKGNVHSIHLAWLRKVSTKRIFSSALLGTEFMRGNLCQAR